MILDIINPYINQVNFLFSHLPVTNPVSVFFVVMLTILLMPLLMRRFNLPGIVGLIFAGIALGPNGFHVLERDASIVLFGTVGIIYIMFFSGLEMDVNDFKANSKKSLVFGLLTFTIPQAVGTIIAFKYMGMNLLSSVLLGSMYASHTLLTYPILSKIGGNRDESVIVTIGGSLVTNTLAFTVLALVVSNKSEVSDPYFLIKFLAISILFMTTTMFFVPKLARWFFKNATGEGTSHFLFVMTIVFAVASLAKIVGLEPVLGAFLAGLALSSHIPSNSILINRIDFVGNSLFIPFFLIYVGMLVDLKIFFTDKRTIITALIMIAVATSTKWIAAFISQKIFKYTATQRNIIFGLSNSQAVGTLAAVLVGYQLKIFDLYILNGTIGMILVTCFIASVVTEKNAMKLVLINDPNAEDNAGLLLDERILVPLSNPNTLKNILDFSLLIKSRQSINPIYPLVIVPNSENVATELKRKRTLLTEASNHAIGSSHVTNLISRISLNAASGIIRVEKELDITHTVIGWSEKSANESTFWGGTQEQLLEGSTNLLFIVKAPYSWNVLKRIVLFLPENAEFEYGFNEMILTLGWLTQRLKMNLFMIGSVDQFEKIKEYLRDAKFKIEVRRIGSKNAEEFVDTSKNDHNLSIIYSGRSGSIFSKSEWNETTDYLIEKLRSANVVLAYSRVHDVSEISRLIR